jgi:hypothetical protein
MPLSPCIAVATPDVLGVLVWWAVILAAPVVFVRRLWRRVAGQARVRAVRKRADRAPPADPGHWYDEPGTMAPRPREAPGEPTESHLQSSTLEPLCRDVDLRRRLAVAVGELERQLVHLPEDRWRIEPYPLTGARSNTLLVLGETGVFVISATYAPGAWDDVVTVSVLAAQIQSLLPEYEGQVHPAICHPFSAVSPRVWHRPNDDGEWIRAWLVGGHSVIEWLWHFGTDHGLGPVDLARFDSLSKPNWLKPAVPAVPSWPPLHERTSTDLPGREER